MFFQNSCCRHANIGQHPTGHASLEALRVEVPLVAAVQSLHQRLASSHACATADSTNFSMWYFFGREIRRTEYEDGTLTATRLSFIVDSVWEPGQEHQVAVSGFLNLWCERPYAFRFFWQPLCNLTPVPQAQLSGFDEVMRFGLRVIGQSASDMV